MVKEFHIPTQICLEAKQFMKQLLRHLADNYIAITGLDHAGLILISWSYHNYIVATRLIEDEGMILREVNARNTAITKSHPAIKVQYDSNAQLQQLLKEYGMTPKSRGVVDGKQGRLFDDDINSPLGKFNIV